MEGNERFAMRRERDIVDAVNKHARHVIRATEITPPEHLFLKTKIYWTKNKANQLDHLDLPEYVLQHVLQGKSIDNILYGYGQDFAVTKVRMKGVPEGAHPIGITVSAETILATDIVPHGVGFHKVKGPGVFLVAGRTSTGRQCVKLFPIALMDDGTDRRVLGLEAPEEWNKMIEAARELTQDFMAPFFEGYQKGGYSTGKIINAS